QHGPRLGPRGRPRPHDRREHEGDREVLAGGAVPPMRRGAHAGDRPEPSERRHGAHGRDALPPGLPGPWGTEARDPGRCPGRAVRTGDVAVKGMEYTDATGMSISAQEELVQSPEWGLQQKFDGTRVLIHLETLQLTRRNGNPLKHTAATQWIPEILQELSDLDLSGQANTILDCELLIHDGTLVVFDVIDPWRLHQSAAERI